MRLSRPLVAVATTAILLASNGTGSAANPWERADIVGQGLGGPTVAPDGAAIRRTSNGVTAQVSMPTPVPGSYAYPQGAPASGVPGHPEAFSLWVFVFFNPDACEGDCDGADLQTNPAVVAGAFNAGGHLVGGPNLTLGGKVNQQSAVFGGANAETIATALNLGYTIAGAEIHVAVAPHGALDPNLLPDAIKTPVGNVSFWWIALFK
jgi:hypothetical protein